MAQEVQLAFPDLVDTSAAARGGYMGVEYDGLVAVCIQGIKEVDSDNHDLRDRLGRCEQNQAHMLRDLRVQADRIREQDDRMRAQNDRMRALEDRMREFMSTK